MNRPSRWLSALLAAALLAGGRPALAQEDLRRDPGFVDFSRQATLTDDDLEVHVSVKDPLIKLVAEATGESDPELAEVLRLLKAVEVHVYEVPENRRETVKKEISSLARDLEDRGWTEAIAIRVKGARGHVFLRLLDEKPMGLAAMYTGEAGEAVFVNIVGQIDAAQVGRLASRYDLHVLSKALAGMSP